MATVFFHADIDCFFAAVEQLDNPELVNKPVVVGGNSLRSVVSTCSYEARKYGVRSGMPIGKAKKLCPQVVILPVRMHRYQEFSQKVMEILKSYTSNFHQISIDEGFLDMTGTQLLFGEPIDVAKKIKREVFEQTGLRISIGIARTKYFAKLASDVNKPDGLYEILAESEKDFIRSMPMDKIWGLGTKTFEKLRMSGILNTEMLMNLSLSAMQKLLGKAKGQFLYSILNADTDDIFNTPITCHSISTERTFHYDIVHLDVIEQFLFQMSTELMYRLIAEKVFSNSLSVKVRYSDFKTTTIQATNINITDSISIFNEAKKLFLKKYERGNPIRLLGIAALKVQENNSSDELSLFDLTPGFDKKQMRLEQTAFEIAQKQGKTVLTRARLLGKPKKD